MEKLNIAEIKQCELFLLIKFAEFCDNNNLCYTLAGGTLLGAIRHKGFIPWDDDIDVMMPRPDYIRLEKLLEKNGELDYVGIAHGENNYPFIKIIDKKVRVEMPYTSSPDSDYLWMDVFPIDGLPSDDRENRRCFSHALFLRKWLGFSSAKIGKGTTIAKSIFKIPFILLARPIGSQRFAKLVDKYCQKYDFDQCDYVGGICWGYGPQERMPKKEWLKREEVEFEGHKFWAPGCWDLYLHNLYGDYMQLPPEEKRVNHKMIAWKENNT